MDAELKQNRIYAAIDLKSFYASVECRERNLDPLTTRLVVADKSRTSKTICLAVTPALKAYGLSGRSRLFEVEEKAREIKRRTGKELDYIVAPPRMALYIAYSKRIYQIYLRYFSEEDIHVYSIDEIFVDLTTYLPLYKQTAHELTRTVIRAILEETGITATAGIAPNLYLCKIAMDIVAKHIPADKDGVRIARLDEESYRRQLWTHRPLTDFWRIGKGISARLEKYRLFTMGDIARQALKNDQILYREFGIDAEILIDHAFGYEPCGMKDIKSYKSQQKAMSSGQVLHQPYDFEKGLIIIREMAEALALDLFQKKETATSITLMVGYDKEGLENYEGELVRDYIGRLMPRPAHGSISFKEPTNSSHSIVDAALYIYEATVLKDLMIRRVNISASLAADSDDAQLNLFDEPLSERKENSLQKARLSISRKFGKNALLKAMDLQEGATSRDRNNQIGGHKA